MTPRRTTLVWLPLVIMLVASGAAPRSAGRVEPKNKVPGRVESAAHRLRNALEKQGYEVAPGYFKLYTQDDCPYTYDVLRSCLGNNPAAPYVLPIVPAWPDEWVDPAAANMAGPTAEGYNVCYRLDPGEAIVILGLMPPPADYFGMQTYLLSRQGEWKEDSLQYQFVQLNLPGMVETFFTKLPKNGERLELFADLSNSINNVVIKNQSGAVWNELRYFVVTPDRAMDTVVRDALRKLHIREDDVFTEQIPSDMNIGLHEAADDFMTLLRYAMPYDGGGRGSRSDAWREHLPLVVMRVRDPRPSHQTQTYPPVAFEARSSIVPPETGLEPDLITLAKAICSKWGQPCDLDGEAFDQRVPALLNMKASPLRLTGPACVEVGMNCLAPTEDTAYFVSTRLPLPDDRVYAVIGALGTETGNATYVGLGLNSSLTQQGFDNIDDEQLAGTADRYDVPNRDRFFLQYFARDCRGKDVKGLMAGSHCYSIGDMLPYCPDVSDSTCTMLALSVRNYLLPGSQRGPLPALTLSPRIIPLQRVTTAGPGKR